MRVRKIQDKPSAVKPKQPEKKTKAIAKAAKPAAKK
jgi:hypothetical protein